MKALIFMAVLTALPYASAHAGKTDVQVSQIGDGEFELVMTSDETTDVAAAQNVLIPGAEKLCPGKDVQFGTYKFETREPFKADDDSATTLVLTQRIACGAPLAGTAPGRPAAVQKWEPAEEDQLRIKLLSYQYLQAKESQDYEAAFAAFSDTTAAAIDFNTWKANQRKFKAAAGAEVSSMFTRVTWYDNPSNASLSGIFAAVDYSSVHANISIHCGYLMWHKNDDGSFELIREEQNHIDNATQKKLSAGEIADIKAKFGCKGP